MLRRSEEMKDFAAALAKAQGEITGATKDKTNPHFKSNYADLASVRAACSDALSKNGIAVIQSPGTTEGGDVEVTTLLIHASGQWIENTFAAKPMKLDAQSIGSVITYLRRYGLSAMVGVAPEDDDGETAAVRGTNGDRTPIAPVKPASRPAVQPQNDNGSSHARKGDHMAWVRQAEDEISNLDNAQDCNEWVIKNTKILDALKKKDELSYADLMSKITIRQTRLIASLDAGGNPLPEMFP